MTDVNRTIKKPGDAVVVTAGDSKVYVWWESHDNVRVTIFATDPGHSRVFNISHGRIKEDRR